MGRLVDIEDVKALINGLDSLPWEEEVDDLVNTIPTAYDVESVIAELEEMEEKAIKVKNVTVSSYACGMIHKAIDIVRKGGVE